MKPFRYVPMVLLQTLVLLAQGQSNVDSLERIVREDRRDTSEARALNQLGAFFVRTDMQKAKSYWLRSVEVSQSGRLPVQLSVACGQLSQVYQDIGISDSALYYLTLMKKLAASDPSGREAFAQTAGLYYKKQSKYKEALPFMLEAMELARASAKTDSSVKCRTDLAGQSLNAGNTYIELGDYQTALRYHLEALRIFEQVGNKKGISFCYQMVGAGFLKLRQLRDATIYTRRSLAIKTELHDPRGIGTSLQQMGSIHRYAREFDSAVTCYKQSINIFRQMGLKKDELNVDLDMSNLYEEARQTDSACAYLERGKLLAQAMGDTGRLATFNAGLIALKASARKEKDTEKKLTAALQHSIQIGDKAAELINYQYLADYYARIGQAQKSSGFIRQYYEMTDSLESIRVQTQLKKMESQYNVDKKEQEIALLKKDQQLSHLNLEKQKILLEKQKVFQYGAIVLILLLLLIGWLVINRHRIVHRSRRAIEIEQMRNHIARDLHDDVGSALTSINIMSKVALQAPGLQQEGQRAVFEKIKDRSSAIIEKMDDIVWTIHPENDTMERLLFRMKEFAAEILEPLDINYDFDEKGDLASLKLDVQKRKDLYLLFKEAVNNAAKYSECCNLHIRLWREKDALQMEILDDGRGFEEEMIRTGNGLSSMRARASSMVAEIHIDSALGKGTRIALDMPIIP